MTGEARVVGRFTKRLTKLVSERRGLKAEVVVSSKCGRRKDGMLVRTSDFKIFGMLRIGT